MILLEVHVVSITIAKFEGNAPRTIDVDRKARWIETLERVKIVATDIQIVSRANRVQPIQSDRDAFMHSCVDLRRLS